MALFCYAQNASPSPLTPSRFKSPSLPIIIGSCHHVHTRLPLYPVTTGSFLFHHSVEVTQSHHCLPIIADLLSCLSILLPCHFPSCHLVLYYIFLIMLIILIIYFDQPPGSYDYLVVSSFSSPCHCYPSFTCYDFISSFVGPKLMINKAKIMIFITMTTSLSLILKTQQNTFSLTD